MLLRALRFVVDAPLVAARRVAALILAEERRKREATSAERDAYRAPEVSSDEEVAVDVSSAARQ